MKDAKGAAITRIGLGKAYFRLERYDEARDVGRGASDDARLQRRRRSDRSDLESGRIDIRLKEYATAKKRFQEALKLSLASDDRNGEADARLGLAVLARRAGELREAIDLIRRGSGDPRIVKGRRRRFDSK